MKIGQFFGFAMLADLTTGQMVWFNRLFSETGELRSAGPAADAVQETDDCCPV